MKNNNVNGVNEKEKEINRDELVSKQEEVSNIVKNSLTISFLLMKNIKKFLKRMTLKMVK